MSLPNCIDFSNLEITDNKHPLCCKAMALATKLEKAFLNSGGNIDKEYVAARVSVLLTIDHYDKGLTPNKLETLKALGSGSNFTNDDIYLALTYEFNMPYLLFWHEQREEYFLGKISE